MTRPFATQFDGQRQSASLRESFAMYMTVQSSSLPETKECLQSLKRTPDLPRPLTGKVYTRLRR